LKIISHRGFWIAPSEQNTEVAFLRALECGFGIETDIRDVSGDLVISHDMPTQDGNYQSLDSFFCNYNRICGNEAESPCLALNIKSDGLQSSLKDKLIKHQVLNYFVFDMSIPQTLTYLNSNIFVFARLSEYEPQPQLLNGINGIWLDQFNGDWYTEKIITDILSMGLSLCIVSPELHNRAYKNCWSMIKRVLEKNPDFLISICTDFPNKAKEFFK